MKRTAAHRAGVMPAPELEPVLESPSVPAPQHLSASEDRQLRSALDWLRCRAGAKARLRADSRAVRAGDVFIALPGRRHNGAGFIAQALRRDACAVLCDAQCLVQDPPHDRSDPLPDCCPSALPDEALPDRCPSALPDEALPDRSANALPDRFSNAVYKPRHDSFGDCLPKRLNRTADAAAPGCASTASQDPTGYVGWDPRVFILPSLHRFVGHLSAAFYGHPSACMPLVAVTGTNGKTSVSHWIAAHWSAPSAVIGTLGERFFNPGSASEAEAIPGADPSGAALTTPDAVALQTQLQCVAGRGAQMVAIEASSIGLHQGRLQGCTPAVAVYTQLSRDHLDYHGSMQAYAQAKSTLFRLLGRSPWGAHAVVHLDDPWTPTMVDACPSEAALFFYGLGEDFDLARARAGELAQGDQRSVALLWARLEDGVEDDFHGVRLRWRYIAPEGDLRHEVQSGLQPLSLLGRFNALNALAVAASWIALGRPVEQALEALSELRPVEGRMDRLGGGSAPLVVVDYAHTPDALEQVLLALRPLARRRKGRLICVVGAGGDRDAGKRPLIGAVAVRHADRVCFTSDNPRSENPLQIIEQILSGVRAAPNASPRETAGCAAANPETPDDQTAPFGDAALRLQFVSTEVDRAVAIDRILAEAAQEDLVLIAGKGHERYQEIGGQRLPFNDRQQAALALARHWSLKANDGARR